MNRKDTGKGAFKQGQEAYANGQTIKDNPHIHNDYKEVQWDKGYKEAEKASKDKDGNFTSHETL